MFSCSRNARITLVENPQWKVICFQNNKNWNLKRFQGYCCDSSILSCNPGSLVNTIVPLAEYSFKMKEVFFKKFKNPTNMIKPT